MVEMTDNKVFKRTDYATDALQKYLAQPVNDPYVEPDTVGETDAFIAGWDAAVDHLKVVAEDLDIPKPLAAIITSILESNRAEYEVED